MFLLFLFLGLPLRGQPACTRLYPSSLQFCFQHTKTPTKSISCITNSKKISKCVHVVHSICSRQQQSPCASHNSEFWSTFVPALLRQAYSGAGTIKCFVWRCLQLAISSWLQWTFLLLFNYTNTLLIVQASWEHQSTIYRFRFHVPHSGLPYVHGDCMQFPSVQFAVIRLNIQKQCKCSWPWAWLVWDWGWSWSCCWLLFDNA